MSEVGVIGLDLAQPVFRDHGPDGPGRVVLRKRLRRASGLEVVCGRLDCGVAGAMEAGSRAPV